MHSQFIERVCERAASIVPDDEGEGVTVVLRLKGNEALLAREWLEHTNVTSSNRGKSDDKSKKMQPRRQGLTQREEVLANVVEAILSWEDAPGVGRPEERDMFLYPRSDNVGR